MRIPGADSRARKFSSHGEKASCCVAARASEKLEPPCVVCYCLMAFRARHEEPRSRTQQPGSIIQAVADEAEAEADEDDKQPGSVIQAMADGLRQVPRMEGFGEKIRAFVEPDIGAKEFGAVAAGEDDLEAGSLCAQFFGQLPAGHPLGHHHISQQ